MEDSKQSEALSLEQLKQIMDKLSRLDTQMQEHFGNLATEISILRHEMKQELDGVKKSLRDVEKSLEAAWDSINDRPAPSKPQIKLTANKLKSKIWKQLLLEEQEKIIVLQNYSRRKNLRFMNVPERNDENWMDIVYDIIEKDVDINVEDIHFHAVHRVR